MILPDIAISGSKFMGNERKLSKLFNYKSMFFIPLLLLPGCATLGFNDNFFSQSIKKSWGECNLRGVEDRIISWQKNNHRFGLKPRSNGLEIEFELSKSNRNKNDGWSSFSCSQKDYERLQRKKASKQETYEKNARNAQKYRLPDL